MKPTKPVKKSVFKVVTATVIASILLTAASAEGICFTAAAVQMNPSETAAMTAVTSVTPLGVIAGTDITVQTQSEALDSEPASQGNVSSLTVLSDTGASVISDLNAALIPSLSAQDLQYSLGQTIADFSKQFNGYKYVYGAASPKSGFDCSGLVKYVYNHMGIELPRTAKLQNHQGTPVTKAELQPGDLVFFATKGGHSITHVGIYLGDNLFIHAATKHQGVIVSNLGSAYWTKTLVSATRIVTVQTALQLAYNSQMPAVNPQVPTGI
jgi:cell wall-associated NlpC family hydrolase